MRARGGGEPRDVFQNAVLHGNGRRLPLEVEQIRRRDGLADGVDRVFRASAAEDIHLARKVGIADRELHEKTVELGMGQQLRARGSDLVFRGDDEKRLRQRMHRAVHRDLPLLHGLEQRGLRFAGGAVDLICQHQIRICHGAGHIVKFARLLLIHGKAHDIARQHIGSELDTGIVQSDRTGKCHGQCRLADAGHVVEQNVPVGQHRHEHLFHHGLLADDDLVHFAADGG